MPGSGTLKGMDTDIKEMLLGETPGTTLLGHAKANPGMFPELDALAEMGTGGGRHKDNFAHSGQVADQTVRTSDGDVGEDLLVAAAAVFHDVGKAPTRKFDKGKVTFHHHEARSQKIVRDRLPRYGFSADEANAVASVIRLAARIQAIGDPSDHAVRGLLADAENDDALLRMGFRLARADVTSKHDSVRAHVEAVVSSVSVAIVRLRRVEAHAAFRPPIDGNRVSEITGINPSRDLGEVLEALTEEARRLHDAGTPMSVSAAETFAAEYEQ